MSTRENRGASPNTEGCPTQGTKTIFFLYLTAYFIHMAMCYLIADTNPIPSVVTISQWLRTTYENVGFHWSENAAPVICFGILSALVLNTARRGLEGLILGWPRYESHDKTTLVRSWIRALFYLALVFFALGAFGQKYSRPIDLFDIPLIATGTFLLLLIVNALDDAISSTFILFNRDK